MRQCCIGLLSLLLVCLSVTQTQADDQWDPTDDTYGNATQLAMADSNQMHGPHTQNQTTDQEDWFKFYLVAGSQYSFSAPCTYGNAIGRLYDHTGLTQVAFNNNSGGFLIHFRPTSTEWYYLKVRDSFFDCSYTLGYTQPSQKQSFKDTQIVCANSINSWSFITRWNLTTNELLVSPHWYNGDYEWRYSFDRKNEWHAIFVYDLNTLHTWELIWAYHQLYVK